MKKKKYLKPASEVLLVGTCALLTNSIKAGTVDPNENGSATGDNDNKDPNNPFNPFSPAKYDAWGADFETDF
ncbi:MAG: hypothetical protein ACOYJK_10380 [Prevotella sp.]